MHDIAIKIAMIGLLGMASQWLAWRFKLPAIVLLLIAGFSAGPLTGYLNPIEDFGDIYKPIVSLAVAIILFEGGLTLKFSEIKHTSKAVRRMVMVAGPMIFIMTALAGHYVAGLSWPVAAVLGGILVITGPTVVMPLLRQASLTPQVGSVLRWEAIINDAIGALMAVIAFEIFLVMHGSHQAENLALSAVFALFVAGLGGWALATFIAKAFVSGMVPDYLKSPILLATVLGAFAFTNTIMEEAGLLTVTVMGITLANSRLASLTELRRFKETITVLLVSGLFILLTASLNLDTLKNLDYRAFLFILMVLVVIRPLAVFTATMGTGLKFKERLFISWIAPRGIVAVAVTGVFSASLTANGVADGETMTAIAFAVVVTTIILHGFSLNPLAKLLGLKTSHRPGMLIVGGSSWSVALASKLKDMQIPVMIADPVWSHIRTARLADIPTFYGEVLSEEAHHLIDFNKYGIILAATENDAYNTLICTDFGPEIGRPNVVQLNAVEDDQSKRNAMNFTLGGRALTKQKKTLQDLRRDMFMGKTIQSTTLSDGFSYDQFLASRTEGAVVLMWVKPNKSIVFAGGTKDSLPENGDIIISLGTKPEKQAEPTQA